MIDNDQNSHDAELRNLFSRLRQEDETRTPPFANKSTVRSAHTPLVRRYYGRVLLGTSACALAVAATIFGLRHEPFAPRSTMHTGAPVASVTKWRPATDFLLNTPGGEMLRPASTLEFRPYLAATPHRAPRR